MKKLFFIMAMSVCAFTAQAQTTSGIRVGLNMTSATGKYNDLGCPVRCSEKQMLKSPIKLLI